MGLGGIMTGTDAIEFMMAGAQAVQVGTATMVDPTAISRIAREMRDYVEQYNLNSITDIVGAVHQRIVKEDLVHYVLGLLYVLLLMFITVQNLIR